MSCGQNDDEQQLVREQQKAASQRYSDLPAGSWRVKTDAFGEQVPRCMKCQKIQAQISANQREPMCYGCLHEQLLGKVRVSMKMKGMVEDGDKVLVAISGGPSSLAMLSLLVSLRNKNAERLERGKVRFQIVPVCINPIPSRFYSKDQMLEGNKLVLESVQKILGEDSINSEEFFCRFGVTVY
eukprot:TRINITY_DN74396_c0_g1_i1.p1 TRINITY_DN74396_c0_g1~~TRINITY_DN74396_c0_g1_i1.p1  ORF type:complete len:183 (-),score=17.42 TRINITY_DN74396_c0_g1_i1:135-683(-)